MPMNEPMPQGQPPVPAEQPQAQQADPKEINKKLGLAAMQIVYDEQGSAKLVEQMKAGAADPIKAVAQAALAVLDRLQKSVKSVDPKAAYAVAPLVVLILLELADAAKLFKADVGMVPEVLKALGSMVPEGQPAEQTAPTQAAPAQQPGGIINAAARPGMQPAMMGG